MLVDIQSNTSLGEIAEDPMLEDRPEDGLRCDGLICRCRDFEMSVSSLSPNPHYLRGKIISLQDEAKALPCIAVNVNSGVFKSVLAAMTMQFTS